MRRSTAILALVMLAAVAGAGGYWAGSTVGTAPTAVAKSPIRHFEPSYYQHPSGQPEYSAIPRKDEEGLDFVPKFEDAIPEPSTFDANAAAPTVAGKVLYYRNPMGLPDTSPVPKKDPMGMDYIPVYAGEESNDGSVKVSLAKVQRLGVRTEPAVLRSMTRTLRAVGTVQLDERRLFVVNAKFEGWIEKLHVNATGQPVRRGQPLMEVYSPELVVAQQEYLLARRSLGEMAGAGAEIRASAQHLAEASLRRLRNWGISDDQVERLERSGTSTRTLTIYSPASGVVLEKTAVDGMRFTAGESLYRIADLSSIWLIADIFEQDLRLVREGQSVKVTVDALPGKSFAGRVSFIYPAVSRETRTAKIRVEVPNPGQMLKADMYARVELSAPLGTAQALAVSESAVLDSGTRQVVLVDRGGGRFEPREVKLGARADGYYEILGGLEPNEEVVVGANFLIDAESNLRAALKTFSASEGERAPK
ncbi:MAG: efflux RND transporter periplasmic adaptor subunit [Alphaproteobacteria bacterium]